MTDLRDGAGPPGWAETLLRLMLRSEDRDVISGDLLEEHRDVERARGRRAANMRYLTQASSVFALEARRYLSVKYVFAACCVFFFESFVSTAQSPSLPVRAAMLPEHRIFLVIVVVALFVTIAGTIIASCWFLFLVMRRRDVASKRSV